MGCGQRFHADWVNVDLKPQAENVLACNIMDGLPFDDNHFVAVYHSHVLEHLPPDQGKRLIEDCFRVLQPGGVLRVVIPDLERIARVYLQMHERAWEGDSESANRYAWIKLELLDQMVRHQSGGMMGRYMATLDHSQESFVRSRIGAELDLCRQSDPPKSPHIVPKKWGIAKKRSGTWRERLSRKIIGWLMGREMQGSFDETLFRLKGEIHRWMYDRFSLRELCESCGFVEFRVCGAEDSDIESFNVYQLDTDGKKIFKPDSLFIECRKPRVSAKHSLDQFKVA